jgi:hypothetical protein
MQPVARLLPDGPPPEAQAVIPAIPCSDPRPHPPHIWTSTDGYRYLCPGRARP